MPLYDSLYNQALTNATTGRDQTLAQLGFAVGPDGQLTATDTGARKRLRLQYGYTASGGYDPSNPFSQASLLREAFQNRTKYNTGSLASQGQLYSGYLRSKQNENLSDFNKGNSQLRSSYNDAMAGLTTQATGAMGGYSDAALAALESFTGRQLAAPAPAPPAPNPLAGLIQQRGGENVRLTAKGLEVRDEFGNWKPVTL